MSTVKITRFILEFIKRVYRAFGNPPMRIGNAPKIALLFRTEEPFKTVVSNQYIDSKGRRAQLEILGNKRQFVAFAIHPDTKKPYKWSTGVPEYGRKICRS